MAAGLIVAGAAAFVLYVLAGYPALLAWRSRRASDPVRKAQQAKTVTVILAVRNGERWLGSKLESIRALDYPLDLLQLVVVSDGSTDRTAEIAAASPGVELVCIPPSGKAAALNAGMERARGEILFFTDVRQPLAPDSLRNLVDCFADPTVGVASGELIILDSATHEEAGTSLYWKYEKWMRKRLSRIDSILGATGCIYAMRRELAEPLPEGTLADDMHLPLAAFFKGYRLILDDSAKCYDYPTSLHSEFRRKVRTLAGVYQVMMYRPALLGPGNRMWFHFVSHKLARLLLPFAMIVIAVASAWLPWPLSIALLAGQAAFYGLALCDPWIGDQSPLKRVSSPARTFVVLVAAALCAVQVLFLPRDSLWKPAR